MPTEILEIRKHAARMIWIGHSTLEIVLELRENFSLGESAEQEMFIRVGQLRSQIQEARSLAPSVAAQMLRDGFELKEISDALTQSGLLSHFEVDGIVSRAQAAVKVEQEAA